MRLLMIRPNLEKLPDWQISAGYSIHWYRPGDEEDWLYIHRSSDRENSFPDGRFWAEFGGAAEMLPERQIFLVNPLHRLTPTGVPPLMFGCPLPVLGVFIQNI